MLRLLLKTGKPIEQDMVGYTVDEMVMLSIELHNASMIKLLYSIWPFISTFLMVEKAALTTRPAVLACILKYVKPENRDEALGRALHCSYWNATTGHLWLVLSSMETLPDFNPATLKFLVIEVFKLISAPETKDSSSIIALIEKNYNFWAPLFNLAFKTSVGLNKLELVTGLLQWNDKTIFPSALSIRSSEFLHVAGLADAWNVVYHPEVENKILHTGQFLRFVDERLSYHELDTFMLALDMAPESLKKAWILSGPVRNRDKAIYKMLTEVANGNIRALIRFMIAHPFELGVIWYAWEKYFDPRMSDIFVRLIDCAVHGVEYV